MKTLSEKAQKFLAKNPTKIGTVAGVDFYEHPISGDESELMAITNTGKLKISDFWELPTFDEVCNDSDLLKDIDGFSLSNAN